MEKKLIDRIIEKYEQEFYKNKNYERCLTEAKKAYRLLERDELKEDKEKFNIYMTLLTIIRCKIKLKRNKTKRIIKYILLSLYYSETKSSKMLSYFILSKKYESLGYIKKSKYYSDIVKEYETQQDNKDCFSKTYNKLISFD